MYCLIKFISHCGHLFGKAGKPGNVRDFDSSQSDVRDFTKSQGSVRETLLSGKSDQKLFIVSCIFASVWVFSRVHDMSTT